jgi:PKD domain
MPQLIVLRIEAVVAKAVAPRASPGRPARVRDTPGPLPLCPPAFSCLRVSGLQHSSKVYDPQRGWREGSSGTGNLNPSLVNNDGVVAWSTVRAGTTITPGWSTVEFVVYDPGRGEWRSGEVTVPGFSSLLINQDGVVAWRWSYVVAGTTYYSVDYAVYDPGRGSWQQHAISGFPSAPVLLNQDGVVAWRHGYVAGFTTYYSVDYAVYDPGRGSWKGSGQSGLTSVPSVMSITNATVNWSGGGTTYTRGYNHNTGAWYSGPTLPFASFVASPTSGSPPLFAWFFDMSIGGTSWNWSFGDGAGSSARSISRTFASVGVYTVTQTVSGPAGTHSTSRVITVGSPCTYAIAPLSATAGPGGGTGNVSVTAPSGCSWTAVSNAS